jgi:hypothetical protein
MIDPRDRDTLPPGPADAAAAAHLERLLAEDRAVRSQRAGLVRDLAVEYFSRQPERAA